MHIFSAIMVFFLVFTSVGISGCSSSPEQRKQAQCKRWAQMMNSEAITEYSRKNNLEAQENYLKYCVRK